MQEITFTVQNITLTCKTDKAMFSRDRLDPATRILLESFNAESPKTILDVGCGWGAISLILAKLYPQTKIVGTDVNTDALRLAKTNARTNAISNCTFYESDIYEHVKEQFDAIISNPPQKAGKEINKKIIAESIEHLHEQGTLWIVGRHNMGGKTHMQWMKELYGNVESAGKWGVFRVYKSVKIMKEL